MFSGDRDIKMDRLIFRLFLILEKEPIQVKLIPFSESTFKLKLMLGRSYFLILLTAGVNFISLKRHMLFLNATLSRLFFIYFRFIRAFHYLMSSVQLNKKKRLIFKGMCALLFNVFSRCSLVQLEK